VTCGEGDKVAKCRLLKIQALLSCWIFEAQKKSCTGHFSAARLWAIGPTPIGVNEKRGISSCNRLCCIGALTGSRAPPHAPHFCRSLTKGQTRRCSLRCRPEPRLPAAAAHLLVSYTPDIPAGLPLTPTRRTLAVLITALLLLRTRSALEAFSSCPHRPWTFHGPFAPAATRKPKFVPPHDTRLCQRRVSHHGRHECNLEGGPVVAHVYSRWDHPQSFASSPSSSRYRHSLPYPADNRSNRFCLIGKPESIHLHCY